MECTKALYGLKSSGKSWHLKFAQTIYAKGFQPSLADPDVWMRIKMQCNLWEYVCVYVDDLAIAMKNPPQPIDKLKAPPESGGYGYQIKGDGPLTFHLHCYYTRDKDGTLYSQTMKYIAKMVESYKRLFNEKPKFAGSSVKKLDHPELDDPPPPPSSTIQENPSIFLLLGSFNGLIPLVNLMWLLMWLVSPLFVHSPVKVT